jgi:hypothetical protein
MNDAARLLRHGNRFLLVVLVCLKLTGDLTWSWWAILAPAWLALGAFMLGAVVMILALLGRRHLRQPAPALAEPLQRLEPGFMTVRQAFAARPSARLR